MFTKHKFNIRNSAVTSKESFHNTSLVKYSERFSLSAKLNDIYRKVYFSQKHLLQNRKTESLLKILNSLKDKGFDTTFFFSFI